MHHIGKSTVRQCGIAGAGTAYLRSNTPLHTTRLVRLVVLAGDVAASAAVGARVLRAQPVRVRPQLCDVADGAGLEVRLGGVRGAAANDLQHMQHMAHHRAL